jgi:L-ascorbate metabolism protein UlaG (beta-lactamase superfamily)
MRRPSALALVALLLPAAAAPAQEAKKLTLRWFGQSFFQLTTTAGTRVVFDPHAIDAFGRPTAAADLVLLSHAHNDHTMIDAVENKERAKVVTGFKLVKDAKDVVRKVDWNTVNETFRDVKIRSVATYHDNSQGLERGKNTVFVLEVDGLKIVHLGDLGHVLSDGQAKEIGPVDVLMIPVGGVYTINGELARQVVGQLKPRLFVVPMHYGTKEYDDLLPPDEFVEGQKHVRREKSNELAFPADLKRDEPEVVLLGPRKPG